MTIAAPALADVKASLRIDNDLTDAQLTRQIAAMTERANRQAPDAPESTAHEAIIRAVGHLYDGVDEFPSPSIWRRSGAAGLLSPWTVRRAGAIEEPD